MNQLACYKTLYNNINSTISNIIIKNKIIKGYTLTCDLPTGVTKVAFPTWSLINGQDDLVWYDAKLSGETAYLTINKANHNNESGVYNTHIYAFNSKGEIISSATTSVGM